MRTSTPDGRRRVVVLGATGMLGHALMYELTACPELEVRGICRSTDALPAYFGARFQDHLTVGVDLLDENTRSELWKTLQPDVVINAVGVVKQDPNVADGVSTVRTNSLLPHQLAQASACHGFRLIHVSTDCVFSGRSGSYTEDDVPDPVDLYGRSKLAGEVDAPALTLRTSIIGHELKRHGSLLDWFLARGQGEVPGFVNAIYSGVTTVEFARFLIDVAIPDGSMSGLWHLASDPISKFDLLSLVNDEYRVGSTLVPSTDFACDRSMIAARLADVYGYRPPAWPQMIREMRDAHARWLSIPERNS